MSELTAEREVKVSNRQGFHARPANLFVQTAMKFKSQVTVTKEREKINGKSILDLLTFGARHGTLLKLEATGEDAEAAVEALAQLILSGFGELEEAS